MEDKTILDLFFTRVAKELRSALSAARKKDETTNQAMLKFRVAEVLRVLGATDVTGDIRVNKDYTFVRIEACKDGFYHAIDFGQRHQAKKAELAAMKKQAASTSVAEAVCVAGLFEDEDGIEHPSFKWESLITDNGEAIAYTGKVRKFHADTNTYDGPVEGDEPVAPVAPVAEGAEN